MKDIEDEEVKLTLKIGRKMIVDWIEAGKDVDFEGWKPISVRHYKKDKIQAWSNLSKSSFVKQRIHTQFSNCKLDDILPYLLNFEKRKLYDDSVETVKTVRQLPLNTSMIYAKLKTIWPVGPRDGLSI